MARSVNRSEASKEKARIRIREWQRKNRSSLEYKAKEAARRRLCRLADPEKYRATSNRSKAKARKEKPHLHRNQWLKWQYGMTLEEFNQRLVTQEGKCAFCSTEHSEDKPLFVDHDHTKPKGEGNRWLLCRLCNTMIGLARDNPDILRRAADLLGAYLGCT